MDSQNTSTSKDFVAITPDKTVNSEIWSDILKKAQHDLSFNRDEWRANLSPAKEDGNHLEVTPLQLNKQAAVGNKILDKSNDEPLVLNVLSKGFEGFIPAAVSSSLSTEVEGMSRKEVFMSAIIGKTPTNVAAFEGASPQLLGSALRGFKIGAGLAVVNEGLDHVFGDGTKHSIFKPTAFETILEGVATGLPIRGRALAVGGAWLAGRAYNLAASAIEKRD